MGSKFKFVTLGGSVDDAAIISQVINGVTLKPLPPANLRGQRDSAGSLLIEWERRSRIGGGLRPYVDAPLGEEREVYIVEIYDGSTLVRSMTVIPAMAQSVMFERFFQSVAKFQDIDQHSLSAVGANINVQAKGLQRIDETGAFVEGILNANGDGVSAVGLIDASLTMQFEIYAQAALNSLVIEITNGSFYSEIASYSIGTDAIVRIVLSGSEVRFYQDYRGPGTAPLYVSQVAPVFPLFPYASLGSGSGATVSVSKVFMNTSTPKTIYSASQQTEDFGSTQSSIKVRVYQVSALVGRGQYAEANL